MYMYINIYIYVYVHEYIVGYIYTPCVCQAGTKVWYTSSSTVVLKSMVHDIYIGGFGNYDHTQKYGTQVAQQS